MRQFVIPGRLLVTLVLILIASILLLSQFFPASAQAPFDLVITSLDDGTLAALAGNATCDLREAITAANTRTTTGQCVVPGGLTDDFRISFDPTLTAGGDTVSLVSALPTLTEPDTALYGFYNTVTNAFSQRVILAPLTAGSITTGLTIQASGAEIAGVELTGFLGAGILVNNVPDATIGLPGATLSVVLVSNGVGLQVQGNNATGLLVENGGFGVRDTGSTCAGNTRQGIFLTNGVSGAQIGSVANPNGISCNGTQGISVSGSNNNTITGNHIGRSLGFGGALAAGNSDSGISVLNSSGTVIGENIIGSNTQFGITLATASNTTISDNQIGLPNTIPLTSSGNGAGGIRSALSNDVLIDSNQIANNGGDGVLVSSGTRVEILDNTIFANVGLGVDLGTNGVNANDPTDSDTGANALLNYPLLSNAATDGTTLLLEGNFPVPTGSYDLLVYENAACDASGFGEGETLLATINAVASGTLNLNPTLAPTVGNFISILAIDRNGGTTDGNTSEFSNCIEITAALTADFSATPTTVVVGQAVTFTNLSTGFITGYSWDFGDTGGATTRNATHAYLAAGTYTVTLTISGPGGTDTDTLLITVVNPTATPLPSNTPIPVTPIPVTATNTPILPTSTNTMTVTRTPIPPSATTTPRPPTLTRTPLPPTSTSTPRPPTSTATLVPSATLTVPPTQTLVATETRTPVPTLPPTIEVTKISDGEQNVQIDIVNSGSGSAQDVVLIETLRDEVRYISSIPGSPRCLESGGIVVCELGTIPPGATSSVGITVQTNGADPASGQTVVTVGGVPGAVVNEPYIIKVGEPPVAGPGAEITYTIRVINATNESALDLQVVDQMPDAIEILSGETSAGTLTIDGQDVLVELDELEAGGRLMIVLQTRVRDDGDYPEIINEACLTSSGNATARCAMMSFLRAGALPNTGETPVYALLLRVGLMVLALLVLISIPLLWWQIRRR